MFAFVVALLAGAAIAGQQSPAARRVLVDVKTSVSAERVEPGQRFQVFLDLAPEPGIHVYAPEVRNYRPIALTVNSERVTVLGVPRYPATESYYYAPLKETVPVYQKPFRVVQDVAVDRNAKPGSVVTIAGVLSYQACDDRICYPPRTRPVTWTVRVMESL